MDLDFGKYAVRVDVTSITEVTSPHTGRQLRELRGKATVADNAIAWFEAAVRSSAKQPVRDLAPQSTSLWKVRSESRSSTNGGAWRCALIITEVEDMQISQLQIGSLTLVPHKYRERGAEPGIHIDALVRVTADEERELRRIMGNGGYLDVIRHGIHDQPVQMRFGAPIWSEKDGQRTYHVILVDKQTDDAQSGGGLGEALGGNTRRAVAALLALKEAIVEDLKARGLVSDADLARIRESANAKSWDKEVDLWVSHDVDEDWD